MSQPLRGRINSPFKKTVSYKGHRLTVYSIGWLAELTKVHVQTLRKREKLGVLPKPLFADKSNLRYYTIVELMGFASIFRSMPTYRGRGHKTDWSRIKVLLYDYQAKVRAALTAEEQTIDWSAFEAAEFPGEKQLTAALSKAKLKHSQLTRLAQQLFKNVYETTQKPSVQHQT